ncbi:SusC/RagA family TonB-linked outer membrane protein [Flavitalea flava]
MKKILFSFFTLLAIFYSPALLYAQNVGGIKRFVSGKVSDSTGNPISGAVVALKGTKKGAPTDGNGIFKLDLPTPGSGILVISNTGYTTQEVSFTGNERFLEVSLKIRKNELDQVIVVGYGKQKKATLTGSVAQISGEEIRQGSSVNITNSLAGRVPGLVANNRSGEPGADGSDLYIRGVGTLGDPANTAVPLIVIDGVANRSGLERLNPNDIESISILKDAAAAIYGAQAANGVILVTTKRGKTGKPSISYDGSFGLSQPTRIPKLVNAAGYAIYKNELNARLNQPLAFTQDQIDKYKAGNDPLNYPSTDWYKTVLKPWTPQTQHSVTLSGGSDKVKYLLSGMYLYQDAFYRKSATNYNQYNLRANIDAQVTDNFKISVDLAGRMENRVYQPTLSDQIFSDILGTPPGYAPFYPNGLPARGTQGANPMQEAQGYDGYRKANTNSIQTLVSFEWKLPFITPGLSFTGFAAQDFNFYNGKSFTHPFDLYDYDSTTNQFTNVKATLLGDNNSIRLNENYGNSHLKTYNLKLGYEKRFGGHNINVFAAFEQSSYYDEGISAFRKNFIGTGLDQLFAGSPSGADINNGGSASQNARRNYFGRIDYGYKDKYLFEFTMRRDGSFNFPPGRQYGNFPGISAGWRISEEPFFKKLAPFVNQLKLKASYSLLGNDRVSSYQFLQRYTLVDPTDNGLAFYTGSDPNTPTQTQALATGIAPNPNITWEKEKNKNIGIESSLWNGMLDFGIEYFFAHRYDILTPRNASIPTSAGLLLPDENIGIVDRHGLEIQIGHKGTINKDLNYNISGNFTYTSNKVVFNDEAPGVPQWQKVQGYPLGSWLVYKTDGIFHSQTDIDKYPHLAGTKPGDIKYIDYDGDKKITSKDQVRNYESPIPRIVFGMTMGANYKGFSLNLLLQGQARAKQIIQPNVNNNKYFVPPAWVYTNRWTADNPNANLPGAFDRTNSIDNLQSDFWLKDMSFVKLKSVQLAYGFTATRLKSLGLTGCRVYISGFNLFSVDKVKYYDPEIINYIGAAYPQTRIFTIGANLSF